MPVDAVLVYGLAYELSETLVGARVDKIQQPERDMLMLSVKTNAGNRKLLLSAGVGSARIHYTAETYENPADAPMFCMLMRKHLTGARITAVRQPWFDRLLVIDLDARDEMGALTKKELIIEMMGRSSNIVLVDNANRITDCIRRMDFGGDAERRLLPGMIYRFPPKQAKTSFFEADDDICSAELHAMRWDEPIEKQLMNRFSGISPLIAREIAFSADNREELVQTVFALRRQVAERAFRPYMLCENGLPKELSFTTIVQYGNCLHGTYYQTFSELLDAYYSTKEKLTIQQKRSKELVHLVKTARDRTARKIASQKTELERTENRDEIRKRAELLTANLYRVKRGDRVVVCQDYYTEGMPELSIELNPLKTPQQNSAAMFKEYNKLKTARVYLTRLLEEAKARLDYLNSVLAELDRTQSEKDLADIRTELVEAGVLKRTAGKGKNKAKPQQPYRYITPGGYEVFVGRNNIQNDELTKNARRTDLWLHTQTVHGSHVILKTDGAMPEETEVLAAAELAAWHSQGRMAGRVAVDYTLVKNVKKPSGSLPGKVVYTDYRTVIADISEDRIKMYTK